jgi:hypothetical protein
MVSIGKLHLQAVDSLGKNLDWNAPIGACLVVQHTRWAVREWLCPTLHIHGPLLTDTIQGGEYFCKLMIFQVDAISDVVEVDSVIWMVMEPRHQHLTNGKGQVLFRVISQIPSRYIWKASQELYQLLDAPLLNLKYPETSG